jgi:hypothetical protein
MAYLNGPASATEYGVVEIGKYINVDPNGVISLPQSVDTTADIVFNTVTSTGAITDSGNRVITSVTPTAGPGISFSGVTTDGPAASFTINSTGVLSLIAGTDIAITGTNSALTIADTSTLESVTSRGASTDQAVTISNTTASTGTTSGALIVDGGIGVGGSVYAAELFDNGNRGITSVVPKAGTGITISGLVSSGPDVSFTVSATGTTFVNVIQTSGPSYAVAATDDYIGVYSTSPVTVNLPTGVNGRVYTIKDEYGVGGGKITVAAAPSESVDGSPTYVISVPRASISVVFRAVGSAPGWNII